MMWEDLKAAFAFLTILPLRSDRAHSPGMFAGFPVVGLVIGAVIAAVAAAPLLSQDLRAFFVLLVWVILTGGLHLDGFADSCDGLLATASPEKRLEIMHDPRAGSWAVAGLVLLLLGKWIAVRQVPPVGLLVVPVIGRWAMVLAVGWFPAAPQSVTGSTFRQGLRSRQVAAASLLAIGISLPLLLLVDWRGLALLAAIPAITWLLGRWSMGRLGGGLNGDVYGAIGELAELIGLIVLSLL